MLVLPPKSMPEISEGELPKSKYADLERDNLRDAQSCAVRNAWRRAYRRKAVGPCTTPGLRNVEKHVFWTTDLGKIERPELGKAPGSIGVRQNGAQCVPRPSKTI